MFGHNQSCQAELCSKFGLLWDVRILGDEPMFGKLEVFKFDPTLLCGGDPMGGGPRHNLAFLHCSKALQILC